MREHNKNINEQWAINSNGLNHNTEGWGFIQLNVALQAESKRKSFITSQGNLVPAIVCSEPLSSLHPQWKWNCLNLYISITGPPARAAHINNYSNHPVSLTALGIISRVFWFNVTMHINIIRYIFRIITILKCICAFIFVILIQCNNAHKTYKDNIRFIQLNQIYPNKIYIWLFEIG